MCFSCEANSKMKTDIEIGDDKQNKINYKSDQHAQLDIDTSLENKSKKDTSTGGSNTPNQQTQSFKDLNESTAHTSSVHFPIRPRSIKSSSAMIKGLRKDLLKNAY